MEQGARPQEYWDEVIAAVVAGDKDRFREIVYEFQGVVRFAVAFHVRGDPDLIDEVVQRTFIRAYSALERFKLGMPLAPWLKRIARNEALREVRTLSRRAKMKRELLQSAMAEACARREAPDAQLDQLRQCMTRLRDEARELVRMRYFERLSFDAIAAALGRTAGALRVAMLSIRRRLRVCIQRGLT